MREGRELTSSEQGRADVADVRKVGVRMENLAREKHRNTRTQMNTRAYKHWGEQNTVNTSEQEIDSHKKTLQNKTGNN